jgi:choline dehydrogenase-like flavoprotein
MKAQARKTKVFDVAVIGTGAGGGIAIKTLTEAGLKVCAINAGRRLDPAKDFRNHRMPWDMKFRAFGDPADRKNVIGFMDNEWVAGVWEREIPFTTAPGTEWMWPRCFAVGGKTNFWGRSSARFGDIDFKAKSISGVGSDWPVEYKDIAPYYSRVEKMIGVSSSVQNRPSNPDGEYLPPFNFRCLDHIIKLGADKVGIPYLSDRVAQLTRDHEGHPACHFCGACTTGCDSGSFFSTPWRFLPKAEATGNLDLRTNAVAKNILVGKEGEARGVAYVDRTTGAEIEVQARAVVVAASCLESARIMLNSRSARWPDGIANSSGQLGRNLCDHLYGEPVTGYLPQLLGQPPFPDNVGDCQVAWMPRWQNLDNPHAEKFVHGYSVYPWGGVTEYPWYATNVEGYGSAYKRAVKRRYPTPISFTIQAPTLPQPGNYLDLDPKVTDKWGIPVARLHFQWDANTLKMWEHAKVVVKEMLLAAGGVDETPVDTRPHMSGWSLHETGTCRMGNDPKHFVTNAYGQTHDVPNLYVADASVFPDPTDKTTTLSIIAFSLRTSEYLLDNFGKRVHERA